IPALLRLEAPRCAHELVQVLDAGLAPLAAILLVVRDEPARLNDVIHLLVQRQVAGFAVELLDELQEAVQALAGARAELGDARARGLPHRAGIRARIIAYDIHALHADAARRQIHDALEGSIVIAAEDEPQVREGVLDFRALEEAESAVDAIRKACRQERFFERTRLRIRAIEERAAAALTALMYPVANAIDDEVRFVSLVERSVQPNRVAALPARPKVLAEPSVVVADERVRRIQDVAGRAIVLLESKELRLRIVATKLLQVLDACAAP